MHVNSVFKLSPGTKFTCNSGLAGRHTSGICKSHVLQHPVYAYIFEVPFCHCCESKVLEMASIHAE